ncbi:MAG: PAS domain S-box protein [Bacteroidetes bacterium]|nr:PAS domain S-box protein [Bacteroidota bacterium]
MEDRRIDELILEMNTARIHFAEEEEEEEEEVSVVVSLDDVTDRKWAERQIQEQAALLDITQDAIIVRDTHDRILFWNKGAERLYGWTQTEALGRNVTDLLFRRENMSLFSEAKNVLLDKGEWRGELHQITKENREITVESRWTAIRDNEGRVISILVVNSDITEKKQLEQQFFRAQRMESLGTLASGIAHDFNNVLGIILGYAHFLERDSLDPARLSTSISSINKAVQRGAGLVRQIMTFARKTDVVPEPVNVASIVRELLKMLEETFPKTVNISAQMRDDLPTLRMDSGQLHQALLNLCLNARDAVLDRIRETGTSGAVVIKADVVTSDQLAGKFGGDALAKRYCCITVSDTGIGMDEATKGRMFEPFFTTKEPGKGTGLGLAVVYGVVQGHSGFVDVDSKVNEGTTFRLYFPITDMAETEESNKGVARVEELHGHETVLIVDDEELILNMLNIFLKDMGYDVLTATDGQKALDTYLEHQKDVALVLTDMGLPLFDGAVLFSKLMTINPSVKVVIASGYVDPHLRSQLLSAGVIDLIQKPYSPRLVARRIREILDNENA